MKLKSLLITTIILLNGCSTAYILHNQKESTLEITTNKYSIVKAQGDLLYESRVNLSNINIYQSVYKIQNGSILTYEDVQVGSGYKFSKGINVIVHNVFKNYSYKLIYTKGNSFFFELLSKGKGKDLYLIVENKNKKALNLVYGFSKENFTKIISAIKDNKSLEISNTKSLVKIESDKSQYIRSAWNYNNIILDNLISKLGSGPRVKR